MSGTYRVHPGGLMSAAVFDAALLVEVRADRPTPTGQYLCWDAGCRVRHFRLTAEGEWVPPVGGVPCPGCGRRCEFDGWYEFVTFVPVTEGENG